MANADIRCGTESFRIVPYYAIQVGTPPCPPLARQRPCPRKILQSIDDKGNRLAKETVTEVTDPAEIAALAFFPRDRAKIRHGLTDGSPACRSNSSKPDGSIITVYPLSANDDLKILVGRKGDAGKVRGDLKAFLDKMQKKENSHAAVGEWSAELNNVQARLRLEQGLSSMGRLPFPRGSN